MGDQTNEPSAQVPADATNAPVQAEPQPQAHAVPEGVQKRFDELTSKIYARDEQVQTLLAQNAQLMASLQAASAPRQAEIPQPDIDPDDLRKLDYVVGRATAPLQKRIDQLSAALGEREVDQLTQPVGDERIQKRARDLMAAWSSRGLLQNGVVTPKDALLMAAGEVALDERSKTQRQRDERGRFNAMGQPLASQGQAAKQTGGGIDPDTLSVDEQVRYYEKKFGSGGF